MNRKLSATQILHGARAYSHNASRRAHQLSGPKRARVMHGPEGDASQNVAANSIITHDGRRPLDGACDCGFVICAKRGPCAPAAVSRPDRCLRCGAVVGNLPCRKCVPAPSARALDNLPAGRSEYRGFTDGPVALPAPAEPSPAGGRTFKTGDRVRGIGCSSGDWREGVVLECYSGSAEYTDGLTPLLADDGSRPFVLTITIEPAPSPVSEAPAAGEPAQ